VQSDSYSFGPFRLDPAERQLLRGGEPVPLTGKAFEVLHLLVRNRGRTVTKEEFMAEVWAGTIVEENNLTDNVSTLRQLLGDDAREPVYIRTVPRRGYRFVAEVGTGDAVPGATGTVAPVVETDAPAAGARKSLVVAAALVFALLLIVMIVLWRRQAPPPSAALRSVAVFPFDALGSDAGETHLGVSLADSLITRLTPVDTLVVRYVAPGTTSADADAFVQGRIRKRGNRIRVTAQLVDARQSRTLWASTFDEDASNLFAVEDRIANEIARELSVRLGGPTQSVPHPEAYEAYGAARYLWRQNTPSSLTQSVALFERAIALDPRFARAHAGLADAYSAMGIWNFRPPQETFPRAKAAALQALALDPTLAEARTALAYVVFRYEWDPVRADEELRRAIDSRPNYATAHMLHAELLIVLQRQREAAAALAKARALDPSSPYVAMQSAIRAYFMRDYRRGIAEAEHLLQREPGFSIARELLWALYRENGDHDRSIEARLATLHPDGVAPAVAESLRSTYRTSGIEEYRRAENRYLETAARSRYVPPIYLAMNHAENGDADLAMQWLEKAYADRSGWLLELEPDPVWDAIRDDPRFIELVARVKAR
jgi:DNA-binding winged helix-turn-helix (wHTH) protein/TolB-like protein